MKVFSAQSLKTRLISISILSLVLLMLTIVFVTYAIDLKFSRQKFENELFVIADIIGNRSQAALTFEDNIAAERNLSAARFHPYIQKLCLYKSNGDLLSGYRHAGQSLNCNDTVTIAEQTERVLTDGNAIVFSRLLRVDEIVVGVLRVHADLSHIHTISKKLLNTLLFALVLSLAVATLAIYLLIRKALSPLSELQSTVNQIADDPFSSLRARKYNNDEVGDLVTVFNKMLDSLNEKKEELQISNEALRRSQRLDAVGRLSGGIAHDYNNILSVILGNTEALKLTNPENYSNHLDNIYKATHRAIELTTKLLKFTHGKPANSEVVDVVGAIREMQGILEHSVTPVIDLNCSLTDSMSFVFIDRGDFEDAILNLVINAKDAMPEGGEIKIETDTSVLDAEYCSRHLDVNPGHYIVVSVSDTGEGMSDETKSRIFEPFFSTKSGKKSSLNIGMGLAMVFGFVKRSNGHIIVASEPGLGTTIRLYLPKATRDGALAAENLEGQELHTGTETILVVDDEEELPDIVRQFLSQQGYQVLIANSGEEALELLFRNHVDLIFTDVVISGGINGYDLANEVSAEYPSVKILLTSGYTPSSSDTEGSEGFPGNYRFISKPYLQKDLLRHIRETLDSEPSSEYDHGDEAMTS